MATYGEEAPLSDSAVEVVHALLLRDGAVFLKVNQNRPVLRGGNGKGRERRGRDRGRGGRQMRGEGKRRGRWRGDEQ